MKIWRFLWTIISISFSLGLFGSFLYGTAAAAEKDFPKKEITTIISFAAGGGRDVLARGVGNTMSKYLGVPMVIMNMPGAGGARGHITLYRSAPDGYTIGVSSSGDLITQIVEKNDYDNKKFTYIGRAESSPLFLFVKSDSPFRSLKDFKTFGKSVRVGTFSLTSTATVTPMVIADREGFPILIVGGYQGGAASILGVIRGEVECHFSPLSTVLPYIQSGQIRPILTIHQNRSPSFPDIPTVGEVGYEDLSAMAMSYYFVAPPGVPKARAQILEEAFMKTLKNPEFLEWAKKAGVGVAPLSGEESAKVVSNTLALLERYKETIDKYLKK